MSGSTIGGVLGAAVGFWVGGPQGAQIGWMIGSAVGAYVDPEKIQGPRLTDAQVQTSRDGVPISWGYGTFPTAGNIIWVQPGQPTEHKTKKREGKGGPVVTTFTYTRSFAIGICRGILREDTLFDPIAGILIVKEYGKLVYDARTDDELLALGMSMSDITASRAASAKFLSTVTFYLGGETQLPDPTMESWEGINNVPAYRGLVYMVARDKDVTRTEGAIQQFEFVVTTQGASTQVNLGTTFAAVTDTVRFGTSPTGIVWDTPITTPSGATLYLNYVNGHLLRFGGSETYWSIDQGVTWTGPIAGTVGSDFEGANVDGRFYMVRGSNTVWYSDDGETFNYLTNPVYGANRSVGGTQDILIVGDNSGRIVYSINDGSSWNGPIQAVGDAGVTAVSEGDNQPVIVIGAEGALMRYTNDSGATWNIITSPFSSGNIRSIVYGNGVYVAVCSSGETAFSTNGTAFTLTTTDDMQGSDVAYYNGLWVLVGGPNSSDLRVFTSEDGDNWIQRDNLFASGDTVKSITAIPCSGIPVPDAPGWYVSADGTLCGLHTNALESTPIVLATIVADLLRRAGLASTQYDVSQLTDVLDGYRIASEGGIDSFLAPLLQGYFFDVAEWDAKIQCVKRGGNSVLTLTMDDLAEKDGDPLEWEDIQESELLRKVTVGYIDRAATYNAVTQAFERRAGTIQALGESTLGLPVVTGATAAAQIAEKRVNCAWAENAKSRFCLPVKQTALTPTDVITVIDSDAISHRVRLMRIEEDSGLLMLEAPQDRQSAYTGTVSGTAPTLPTFPSAPLIGPTQMAIMNIPVWREADDQPGLYIAVRGILSDWAGANLLMSTDSGATFNLVDTITDEATIGYTTTDIEAWYSSEYPSIQSVTVWLPEAPESVSYETMLRYNNRAAVQLDTGEWEILQYQTVVANGDNSYTLSDLLRGRYATTPGEITSGATFVLLDGYVHFLQVERWMIGETLTVKAASLGTDPDANAQEDFDFTTCASQTEWMPTYVQAERDGSDNVTVTWVGRGRLGTENAPHHSQYFTGYRVTFDTGTSAGAESFDTTEQTYTLASAADPITVTVSAINSITGSGPASAGIIL